MKTLSAATAIALALTAGSALAADLPSRKAPPVYVAPAPIFTWTGFYAGINIGYGWSERTNLTGYEYGPAGFTGAAWGYSSPDANGVLGGGQIGYNYQFAGTGFVVGIEADIQAADLSGSTTGIGSPAFGGAYFPIVQSYSSLDWFGTVRGRLGYSILPNLLVYGTGGFAYGEGSSRFTYWNTAGSWGQQSYADTRTGWTAGGGVEWAFLPNWSAKVEYLYVDLGRSPTFGFNEYPATTIAATQRNVENRFHTVKVGLNYHFNLFGSPAPVVAKY